MYLVHTVFIYSRKRNNLYFKTGFKAELYLYVNIFPCQDPPPKRMYTGYIQKSVGFVLRTKSYLFLLIYPLLKHSSSKHNGNDISYKVIVTFIIKAVLSAPWTSIILLSNIAQRTYSFLSVTSTLHLWAHEHPAPISLATASHLDISSLCLTPESWLCKLVLPSSLVCLEPSACHVGWLCGLGGEGIAAVPMVVSNGMGLGSHRFLWLEGEAEQWAWLSSTSD